MYNVAQQEFIINITIFPDNRQKINNTENECIFFLKKYWMLLTVLTISIITIAVAIYVTHFSAPDTQHGDRQILFGRNYETGTSN